jgi:hypothetical protein
MPKRVSSDHISSQGLSIVHCMIWLEKEYGATDGVIQVACSSVFTTPAATDQPVSCLKLTNPGTNHKLILTDIIRAAEVVYVSSVRLIPYGLSQWYDRTRPEILKAQNRPLEIS